MRPTGLQALVHPKDTVNLHTDDVKFIVNIQNTFCQAVKVKRWISFTIPKELEVLTMEERDI